MKEILNNTALKISFIVSIVAGLAVFGLDASGLRPALSFEVEAVKTIVFDEVCNRLSNEWYRAKETEEGYRQRGEPIPDWLVEKIINLERQMREFGCNG